MSGSVKEFNEYRAKMNDKIMADNNKNHQTHLQFGYKRVCGRCFGCKNEGIARVGSFYRAPL